MLSETIEIYNSTVIIYGDNNQEWLNIVELGSPLCEYLGRGIKAWLNLLTQISVQTALKNLKERYRGGGNEKVIIEV